MFQGQLELRVLDQTLKNNPIAVSLQETLKLAQCSQASNVLP